MKAFAKLSLLALLSLTEGQDLSNLRGSQDAVKSASHDEEAHGDKATPISLLEQRRDHYNHSGYVEKFEKLDEKRTRNCSKNETGKSGAHDGKPQKRGGHNRGEHGEKPEHDEKRMQHGGRKETQKRGGHRGDEAEQHQQRGETRMQHSGRDETQKHGARDEQHEALQGSPRLTRRTKLIAAAVGAGVLVLGLLILAFVCRRRCRRSSESVSESAGADFVTGVPVSPTSNPVQAENIAQGFVPVDKISKVVPECQEV